jgi:hypothetical protein
MSNNFLRILSTLSSGFLKANKSVSNIDIVVHIASLFIVGGVHATYAYSTNNNEDVKVTNKYKMVSYGSTQFMIVDDKGRHFNVNNSLWYWKWDSIEDWEKINKGNSLKVKYYGFRSPFLGLFPNIVRSYK